MKVLVLSSRFHPDKGGVENVVQMLFDKYSGELKLIVSHAQSTFSPKIKETLNGKEITRIWMGRPDSLNGWLVFPYRFLASLFAFVSEVKQYNPDLINYHFPDDSIFLFSASRFFIKTKYVLNLHGEDFHSFSKRSPHSYFWNKLINNSSGIIVNSDYMRGEVMDRFKLGSDKIFIIPNGIDIKAIDSIASRKYIEEPYIFAVGRFVFKKGFDILVTAFKESNLEQVKLVIEGKGEELESIKSLVSELDLSSKVILTGGTMSADEKVAFMKGSLFGVVPSRKEPFGIVALEFMAANVPVIVSATGGLLSLVENGVNGILFENESELSLADKLTRLRSDIQLRSKLKERGRETAEKFSYEMVTSQYLTLFEKLI